MKKDVDILKIAHKRIFLIESSDLFGTAQTKDYLDHRFTKLEKKQFSKNVWLHVYQTEYKTTDQVEYRAIDQIIYTVLLGDSISKIALRYYGDMFFYKKILDANPLLRNIDRINPGDILVIPK